MSDLKKRTLIVILGPTAVGKTSVSIELAQRFGGEIVSADSRLLYRGMDIGTAKPTPQEKGYIPHHLIDVADPDEIWNLALYLREAYKAIDDIHARGNLPFLAGGTGQYIRSIIEGWRIPPQSPDDKLRIILNHWAEEIGAESLHSKLALLDPEAADKIDFRNLRRTVRALEVILNTGERFSALRQKQSCRYQPIILGIERTREELYDRIDKRIELMLESGLIDEVRGLLDQGIPVEHPNLSAIGYAEIIQFIRGELTYEEAVALIKRNTRIFVRRQANWFKPGDKRIIWVSASENTADEMEEIIRSRLDDE